MDKGAIVGGEYSNKTTAQIDNWRMSKVSDWDDNNLGGTLIMGEGRVWIELEGDDTDVDNAVHNLENDPFLDSCYERVDFAVKTKAFNFVISYHEDRPPISAEMVDECPC